MSRELTLRQRGTDFEGRPNRRALVALGGVVLVAFVGGFLLHPGEDDAPAPIPAQRLASDAPASESAATPALRGTVAFPGLREEPRRRTRPRKRAAAEPATPASTPTPALITDDTAAPTPDPVTPATPAPAPAAPAPAAPAPKPAPPAPSSETFDSTG